MLLQFDISPVACPRPRVGRFGVYYPKKYQKFKEDIQFQAKNQYINKPLEGALKVCVDFGMKKPQRLKTFFPTKRPDIDNLIKSVFDSLKGIVWKDDSLIVQLESTKRYSENGEYISISVVEL